MALGCTVQPSHRSKRAARLCVIQSGRLGVCLTVRLHVTGVLFCPVEGQVMSFRSFVILL